MLNIYKYKDKMYAVSDFFDFIFVFCDFFKFLQGQNKSARSLCYVSTRDAHNVSSEKIVTP